MRLTPLATALTALTLPITAHTEVVNRTVTLNSLPYILAHKDGSAEKGLSLWEFIPEGQTLTTWSNMFTITNISRPNSKITPQSFLKLIENSVHARGRVLHSNVQSSTLCYVMEGPRGIETNAWKAVTGPDGLIWTNAVQQTVPPTDEGIAQINNPQGPFWTFCNAMSQNTWDMKYPATR